MQSCALIKIGEDNSVFDLLYNMDSILKATIGWVIKIDLSNYDTIFELSATFLLE